MDNQVYNHIYVKHVRVGGCVCVCVWVVFLHVCVHAYTWGSVFCACVCLCGELVRIYKYAAVV